MVDINAEYKDRFHTLTLQLGRPPDSRDKEYWELADWQRNAYRDGGVGMPEVWKEEERQWSTKDQTGARGTTRTGEHVPIPANTTPTAPAGAREETASVGLKASHEPAPQTSARDAREGEVGTPEALGRPGAAEGGTGALSEPRTASELSEASQAATEQREQSLGLVGSRGPSGGMVARCGHCGGLWERPKQRGRPPSMCGECR